MPDEPTRPSRPRVEIVEEGLRDGLQIEDRGITVAQKIELLDALSRTGLRRIVVGAFVSPKWNPQMAETEKVIEGMTPVDGVEYSALAIGAKGAEIRRGFVPPLTVRAKPRTLVHACDVFAQRNTNRGQWDEIKAWPAVVEAAVRAGAEPATIAVNAAFGSNWVGGFGHDVRMTLLERQWRLWDEAGIGVDSVWLGDPMGWNTPGAVEATIADVQQRWPDIREVHLHLHNTRGCALVSAYTAWRAVTPDTTLVLDSSIGGIGGCPYCGNGRATGMIPTEDLVDLLEEEGADTGIDRTALIDAAVLAAEIVGRQLDGKLARAGVRPRGAALYPMDMPFVETFAEASHFRRGPEVYDGQTGPWATAIRSLQREAAERGEPVPMGEGLIP